MSIVTDERVNIACKAYDENAEDGRRAEWFGMKAALEAYEAAKPAAQGEAVAVPDGWKLVPESMTLTKEAVASLAYQLGGDLDSEDADDHWCAGVLWVGETEGDHGEKYYGLNAANMECLEEGSLRIVEFAAPQPAAESAEVKPPAVEPLPQSSAPAALYQHDDGRYALALGDVARHKLTDGEPGWHLVPLDVVATGAEGEA